MVFAVRGGGLRMLRSPTMVNGHFSDFFPNFAYMKLVELSSSALNCHLIIIMYSASAKI